VQVLGIPVAEEYNAYLEEVAARLRQEGIRVEVDESDDRFPKKIRNASKAKVPFVLIAGEEDRSAGAVSFRYRSGEQKNGVPVEDAVAEIVAAVRNRAQV
jgi:threonyl-tRNA synthetase